MTATTFFARWSSHGYAQPATVSLLLALLLLLPTIGHGQVGPSPSPAPTVTADDVRTVRDCNYTFVAAPQSCAVSSNDGRGSVCESLYDEWPRQRDVGSDFPPGLYKEWGHDQTRGPTATVSFRYGSPQTFNTLCFQQRKNVQDRAVRVEVFRGNVSSPDDEGGVERIGLYRTPDADTRLRCYTLDSTQRGVVTVSARITANNIRLNEHVHWAGGATLLFAMNGCAPEAGLHSLCEYYLDHTGETTATDDVSGELQRRQLAVARTHDGQSTSGVFLEGEYAPVDPATAELSAVALPATAAPLDYDGGVYLDGYIFLTPSDAAAVVRFNAATGGDMRLLDRWPTDGSVDLTQKHKFIGGVADDGHVWLPPLNAQAIIRINPTSEVMSSFRDWPVGVDRDLVRKFAGAASDGEAMWLVPYQAPAVVRMSYADGRMTKYDRWPQGVVKEADSKFSAGVIVKGKFYLSPFIGVRVVVFLDTITGHMSKLDRFPDTFVPDREITGGLAFDGRDSLWMSPDESNKLVLVNVTDGLMRVHPDSDRVVPHTLVTSGFDGERMWYIADSSRVVVFCNDTGCDSLPLPAQVTSTTRHFRGIIFDGRALWLVPWGGTMLVRVGPFADRSSQALPPRSATQMSELRDRCGVAACDGASAVLKPYTVGNSSRVDAIHAGDGYGSSGVIERPHPVDIAAAVTTEVALGDSGLRDFGAAVLLDGAVYFVPGRGDTLDAVSVNVTTSAVRRYPVLPSGRDCGGAGGQYCFASAVADGGYVWMIPYAHPVLVRLDPVSGNTTAYERAPVATAASSTLQFAGGASDGVWLWMAPYSAMAVMKVRMSDGTMVAYDEWPAGVSPSSPAKFAGAALTNNDTFWMAPHVAKVMVRVDTRTGQMSAVALPTDGVPLVSAAFAGTLPIGVIPATELWLTAHVFGDHFLLNLANESASSVYSNVGERFHRGAAYDGRATWLPATQAADMTVINGSTDWTSSAAAAALRGMLPQEGRNATISIFDGQAVWSAAEPISFIYRVGCNVTLPGACPASLPRSRTMTELRRQCLAHPAPGTPVEPKMRSATESLRRVSVTARAPSNTVTRRLPDERLTLTETMSAHRPVSDDDYTRIASPTVPTPPTTVTSPPPSPAATATSRTLTPVPQLPERALTPTRTHSLPVADTARLDDESSASTLEPMVAVTAPASAVAAVGGAVFSPAMAGRATAYAGVARARRCGGGNDEDLDEAAYWEYPAQPDGAVGWATVRAVGAAAANVVLMAAALGLAWGTTRTVARPQSVESGAHGHVAVGAAVVLAYLAPPVGSAAGTAFTLGLGDEAAAAGLACAAACVVAVAWQRARAAWLAGQRGLWAAFVGGDDGADTRSVALWVYFSELIADVLAAGVGSAAGAASSGCVGFGLALALLGLAHGAYHVAVRPFGRRQRLGAVDTCFGVAMGGLWAAQGALLAGQAAAGASADATESAGSWVQGLATLLFFVQPVAALWAAWRDGRLGCGSHRPTGANPDASATAADAPLLVVPPSSSPGDHQVKSAVEHSSGAPHDVGVASAGHHEDDQPHALSLAAAKQRSSTGATDKRAVINNPLGHRTPGR